MKITSLRTAVLAGAAFAVLFFSSADRASAGVFVNLRIGPQGPPPPVVEHPWARPYRGAVWIPGHYEWIHGRYVWIGGYYSYPPQRGGRWVGPSYVVRGGVYYYSPGRWAY